MMLSSIRRYMERQRMSEPGEPLWVAVSGGVDSMVLLHVLRRLHHPVHVVHVEHGTRGADSERDMAFVQEHCDRHRIPFQCRRVDVPGHAREHGISQQMAARELRYGFFHEMLDIGPPRKMALAHHQDDAIETLFIELIRGIGSGGWRTIPPISGPFIRPLSETSRTEILAYANEQGIQWREDGSNSDPKYLRNRIRHELLPLLEEIRPGARGPLVRAVQRARELDHLLGRYLGEVMGRVEDAGEGAMGIPVDAILGHGAPRLVLDHLLRHHGFHPDRLEDLLFAIEEGRTGSQFEDGGVRVLVDRGRLIITSGTKASDEWTIEKALDPPPDLPLRMEKVNADQIGPGKGKLVVWLDHGKICYPLHLRPWRPGDRMRPTGMKGRKLISDMLIDAKVPRTEKERTYVLMSGEEIIWLIGHRIAEGYSADARTRDVLRLEWVA